jgi:hypothetical protein
MSDITGPEASAVAGRMGVLLQVAGQSGARTHIS